MHKIIKISLIMIVFALMAFFIPQSAGAGNDNSFFLGNDAALAAGSHAAIVRDSDSIWYNPAGLGGNGLTRINLSGNAFELRLQSIPGGMKTDLPSGQQSQDLSANEYLAVPTTITFMRMASEKVSYGIGIYMPQYTDMTFSNSLTSTEFFSTLGENVIYTQGFNYDLLNNEYDIGAATGWQPIEDLRLGASFFVVYDRYRYNRNLFEDIDSADGSGNVSLFYTDNTRFRVSTIGARAALGLQYEISPKWSVGLVAFSPTFQIYSWGEATAAAGGVSRDSQGNITSSAARIHSDIREWDGKMVVPFHAQASVGYTTPDYWIGLAADFYLPLKTPSLQIDNRFGWNICAGSKFKLSDKFSGGAGFFTDMSREKSPDELAAGQVNYYGITFGGEFKTPISKGDPNKNNAIYFTTTLSGRYAIGLGKVGGLLFDPETDGNITLAHVNPVNVIFQELALYIGSGIYF